MSVPAPIRWEDGKLLLLDQRQLPRHVVFEEQRTVESVVRAIRQLRVRGAPAIGVAAAYAMAMAWQNGDDLEQAAAELRGARPTAVNLFWAIDRMKGVFSNAVRAGRSPAEIGALMVAEARRVHDEDIACCRALGAHGAALLPEAGRVLTHCNAGALATGGYGTALGVIRAAVEGGKRIAVYADETRPFLQGSRLTAWELLRDGIDTTIVTDGMAGSLFRGGKVDAVVVGADRIAANGDVANKIGTYTVAVLAREHDVPFYVAAPTSTIDLATADGDGIPIEERSAREVTHVGSSRVAAEGAGVWNPAFDVTPHRFVAGIVTERGICRPPYDESLAAVCGPA